MSVETFWMVASSMAMWVAMALFRASIGGRDRKLYPIDWARRLVVGFIVTSPVLVLLPAIVTGHQLLAGLAAVSSSLAWNLGKRLPVVGTWVSVAAVREDERARKGIL